MATTGAVPLAALIALDAVVLVGAEHGGGTNLRHSRVVDVAAHAILASGLGQHRDHAGGESGHLGQVQVAALAIDNHRHGGGGDELNVGLFALELLAPVVDLDASDDGVVGLRGVHSLGDEVLQVLQTTRGGCTCERPFA